MTTLTAGLSQTFLLTFVAGLILVLVGVARLSDGLQRLAGDRIRSLLTGLVKNRLLAALVGCLLTMLSQSSAATMIMVVGIVNAGLLTVLQGVAMALGANVGASLALQLLTIPSEHVVLPLLGGAVVLRYLARKEGWRDSGQALLGFGLLLLGLLLIRAACSPLGNDHEFRKLLLAAGNNPWLCLLLGAGLSALLQSTIAVAGIVLAVAVSGLLPFSGGVAMLLGANAGAMLAPNLAAIGSNLAARRTALAATVLQLFSVVVLLLVFPWVLQIVQALSPGEADFVVTNAEQAEFFAVALGEKPHIARHLVNANTLLTCLTAGLLLPLLGQAANLVSLLLRGQEASHTFSLQHIDYRVLNTPPLALGQARSEVRRMARLAAATVTDTCRYLQREDKKLHSHLVEQEQTLDLLHKEISNFLVALAQRSVSLSTSREIANMLQIVSDLERIGDHCQSLVRLVVKKRQQRITFSAPARHEVAEMATHTAAFLQVMLAALDGSDVTLVNKAQECENEIDAMETTLREQHMTRLHTGECSAVAGLIFIDILHHLEKIADHTYKVVRLSCGERDDAGRH